MKVDKTTKNVSYDNNRANQLNQIEKLVVDKPVVIKEKVKKIVNNITVEEEATPQQLRRSTRVRKERDILDL